MAPEVNGAICAGSSTRLEHPAFNRVVVGAGPTQRTMKLETVRRIERAFRHYPLSEDEAEASPETQADVTRINQIYRELKAHHSFSWAIRVAKTAWACELLGIPFDGTLEEDGHY